MIWNLYPEWFKAHKPVYLPSAFSVAVGSCLNHDGRDMDIQSHTRAVHVYKHGMTMSNGRELS